MKKDRQDRLDGTYTQLLMRVQNISWCVCEHKTKADIYNGIPSVSSMVSRRTASFVGHCYRAKYQIISDVICMRRSCLSNERRPINYIDSDARDTNQVTEDLPDLMMDRDTWRCIVDSISDSSA